MGGGEGEGENRERDRSTTRARNASFGICSTAAALQSILRPLIPTSRSSNSRIRSQRRTSTVSSISTALDNRIADAHKRSWQTKPQIPRLTPPPHSATSLGIYRQGFDARKAGFACEERLAGDGERVREVGRWGGCRADGDAGGMEVEVWVLDVGMGEGGGCRGTWERSGQAFWMRDAMECDGMLGEISRHWEGGHLSNASESLVR